MASARQQEEALRLQVEALKYVQGVPPALISQIQASAESLDISLNDRFMRKLKAKLMSYLPPLRSTVEWKQHMVFTKLMHQEMENSKKELRNIFKLIAGVEGIYPEDLRETPLPDIKDTVEKIDYKTYGVNPFRYGDDGVLADKELLRYQGPYTWQSFTKTKVECGNVSASDPGKRKVIFSLTTLSLLEEMMNRGADFISMVKVVTDYFREQAPDIASRINSISEVGLREILSTIETCVDIPSEIKLIEKAIRNIYRDPSDNIKVCGDSFNAKQLLLFDLRSIQTHKMTEEERKDQESRVDHSTVEYCLELVSEETKNVILELKMKKNNRSTAFTLSDFYYEVTELERKNPSLRIKDRKTMKAAHAVLPIQINHAEAADEEEEEDEEEADSNYYGDQGDYYNEYDDNPDPEEFEDEYYENYEEEEEAQETPDGSSCFFIAPSQRGGGRGRASTRSQASRSRGRGRGRPRPRGQGQVRQVRGGQRPRGGPNRPNRGFNFPPPGRSGPSRPPGQQSKHCIRCGESSHGHSTCKKFAMYHSELCPLCPTLNPAKQGVYHPRALCPYNKDGGSNYRSPRARSPASWMAHGFDESGNYRTGTSIYVNRTKN